MVLIMIISFFLKKKKYLFSCHSKLKIGGRDSGFVSNESYVVDTVEKTLTSIYISLTTFILYFFKKYFFYLSKQQN